MLLSHLEWLCFILPTLIAATPQAAVPLPDKLNGAVPACAQPCLRRSLSEQFPLSCAGSAGLTCLCSRYSFGGETLGEVALGCIYASCSSTSSAAAAYNVCLGQLNAVAPTLTALTVPSRPPITSSTTSSSRPITTTTPISSSSTTNTPSPRPSPTDTVIVDSVAPTPSPTDSTSIGSPPTAPATAAGDTPRTMKPAQIAGLSVAAAATFIIAIGLMALSIRLRRRREGKNAVYDEKRALSPSPRDSSEYFPQYPPVQSPTSRSPQRFQTQPPTSEPPKRFPMPPAPVLQLPPAKLKVSPVKNARAGSPFGTMTSQGQPKRETADFSSVHPLFRPGAGMRNSLSGSSLPPEQIGVAISAELPGDVPPSKPSVRPTRKTSMKRRKSTSVQQHSDALRPDTVYTQDTVFEEDEPRDDRRESKLLPMPPVPIPPIRAFQPSRKPSISAGSQPPQPQPPTQPRQYAQPPELFLSIPPRHSRSQPIRILPTENPPRDVPAPSIQTPQNPQLAPAIRIPQTRSRANTGSGSELSGGDIPDYYFTAWQDPRPKGLALSFSPNRRTDSPKTSQVKPKNSSSTVSRANSTTSTNNRDSFSSQTSFETADPNDPTPEDDDDDKQLDGNRLSPVAESPISNLRYPKVPRASNVYVPRSPRSPMSQNSQDSPQRAPSPLSLFMKRRGEQGPLRLDSPHTGSPVDSETRAQTRRYRQHMRTTSDETWSTLRASERSTRTQSGQWPKSPAMYESDIVRPLTIRSKTQQQLLPPPVEEMQALKSPAWVPRLTPTRQGEDLLISVTYSKPGH